MVDVTKFAITLAQAHQHVPAIPDIHRPGLRALLSITARRPMAVALRFVPTSDQVLQVARVAMAIHHRARRATLSITVPLITMAAHTPVL